MSTGTIAALSVLGALLFVAVVATFVFRRLAATRQPYLMPTRSPGQVKQGIQGCTWVIANPTKVQDYQAFKDQVSHAVAEATGRPAMWIETSAQDPGTGQAIEALRYQPSLVIAAGGDGTVRAVAAGMSHSGVPMALLPMGTGNLLARNLGLPIDMEKALAIALTPVSRKVDLAWMRLERITKASELPAEGALLKAAGAPSVRRLPDGVKEPGEDEFAYAVIAGVGFDGQTMIDTDPNLKKKIGWSAYVLAALKSLRIERMKATITIYHPKGERASDIPLRSTAPIPKAVEAAVRQSHTLGAERGLSPAIMEEETWDMTGVRARTIMFANCGTLPFVILAPDATLDDGKLDVIAIDTRAGLLGWGFIGVKVVGQSAGLKTINLKNDPGAIQFRQTAATRVDISKPYPVQADGDPIGEARTIYARVDEGALLVRVPPRADGAIPDEERDF